MATNIKAFTSQMNSNQRVAGLSLARSLQRIGPSPAVEKFLDKYGPVRTKSNYAIILRVYLRWLREEKGLNLNPYELIKDNLVKVHESEADSSRTLGTRMSVHFRR